MRHSFAPFGLDEVMFLSAVTRVDYTRTDFSKPDWLCVSARAEDGRLMGLCCFEFRLWFDAFFSIAIRDPRCITRRVMRSMFTAAFSRAVRITAEIEPGNERAIRQARLMGFRDEGFKRLAIEGSRDAMVFGMLREDCRYLAQRRLPAAFPLSEVTYDGQQPEAA